MRGQRLLLGLMLLFGGGSALADDALFGLIDERLRHMRDVALHKWHHQLPIEDVARERVVVRSARRAAVRHGVDGDGAERFFIAQIQAAKTIQSHWFERWVTEPPRRQAPDLATEIRPRLLELGDEIVARLRQVPASSTARAAFDAALPTEGLSTGSRDALFAALGATNRYASTLARIAANGELRVGTAGDYAPFTYSANDESWVGVDIDQARDLGKALGVPVRFVPTSWPTLMDDVLDGRFDIAMGGISRNVARARLARFTGPYFTDGKTAIARCADAALYTSLGDVDRPGVRVIVNSGGTNQRFVDANIREASVIVWPDNRTVFDEIAAGRADVMFTDGIEVRLQTVRHPGLCGALPALTYLDKAYLIPRIQGDGTWLETVNVWLEQRVASGAVERLIEHHVNAR